MPAMRTRAQTKTKALPLAIPSELEEKKWVVLAFSVPLVRRCDDSMQAFERRETESYSRLLKWRRCGGRGGTSTVRRQARDGGKQSVSPN